ncbi:pilus assembly protein [Tatumella terrea]|uniref:Pilus assembly protein n=1 Tax=Tatumella terrea TaxID=419007 RepID=A0ABW1VSC3_9GAMM
MNFQRWNVGLDIQPDCITALGVQARRTGWQLRHWWQHRLPSTGTGTLDIEGQRSALLSLLHQWRRLLPGRFSLRIGLPPHLVSRRELTLPMAVMCEPQRGRYIRAAARRWFPEGTGPLGLDYTAEPFSSGGLTVTVVNQEVLDQWQALFRQAGLNPEVFDLSPASLAVIMEAQQPEKDGILLHCSDAFWLWATRRHGKISYGWQFRQQVPDADILCRQQCPEAAFRLCCGDSLRQPLPGFTLCHPLRMIAHRYPPLPANDNGYVLATGLALRPEDSV